MSDTNNKSTTHHQPINIPPLRRRPSSLPSTITNNTPIWFKRALEHRPESLRVKVDHNIHIHCLRWGKINTTTNNNTIPPNNNNKRAVIFIHGGGASNVWYRSIAPFFADEFEVIAISNSGCGESDERTHYSITIWSEEIEMVCSKLGLFDSNRPNKPYIVAHSLGCSVVHTMLLRQLVFFDNNNTVENEPKQMFDGVIFVDGAIRDEETASMIQQRIQEARENDPHAKPREGWKRNPVHVTPYSRYVLRPYQTCKNSFLIEHIAESSIQRFPEDGSSWQWLGDCNRDAKLDWNFLQLTDVSVRKIADYMPVSFVYGEHSIICDESVVNHVRETLGNSIGIVMIPDAQHHVWLDQPIPFIGAILGIVGGWNPFALNITMKSSTLSGNNNDQKKKKREAELQRIAQLESKM
jgi:pimeloyl-ACP methyl ester carboxylesterase